VPVEAAQMVSSGRIQTVPLRTLTTRIYIDDANNHKVVQLTNLLTSAMVIQYLRRKGLLDSSEDWSLFEIANSHGVGKFFFVVVPPYLFCSLITSLTVLYRATHSRMGDCTRHCKRLGT
jgi:hypothetical protein